MNTCKKYELGNKIKTYRPNWLNIIPHFLLAGFYAISIWIPFSILFYFVLFQNIISDKNFVILASICFCFLIAPFIAATSIMHVSLFQEGLICKYGWWKRIIYYSDIKGISCKMISYNYGSSIEACRYKLNMKKGFPVKLDNRIFRIEELGSLVETEIINRCKPDLISKFQSGLKIRFGIWKVDKKGMGVSTKFISWSDIGKIEIRNGMIYIFKRKRNWFAWHEMPLAEIPNLKIFLDLIDQEMDSVLV
jgi:hypothetical protein